MTRWKAELALVLITLIWGATFVVVKRALDDVSALLFIALRFSAATLLLALVYRRRLALSARSWGGVLAGLCLFLGYAFQTAGLRLTGAAKAAFITGMFIVLVPLLNAAVYRWWPQVSEVIGVVAATAGLALMTLESASLTISTGDLLVLVCAAAFAAHTVVVGHYSSRVGFERLAVLQIGTSAALALGTFWWLEPPYFRLTPAVWGALAVTSVLATALALTLQAWAQQFTSSTRTALIFSLEPVFAWITSFLVAGETLSARAAAGAALILAGILAVELKPVGAAPHPFR